MIISNSFSRLNFDFLIMNKNFIYLFSFYFFINFPPLHLKLDFHFRLPFILILQLPHQNQPMRYHHNHFHYLHYYHHFLLPLLLLLTNSAIIIIIIIIIIVLKQITFIFATIFLPLLHKFLLLFLSAIIIIIILNWIFVLIFTILEFFLYSLQKKTTYSRSLNFQLISNL